MTLMWCKKEGALSPFSLFRYFYFSFIYFMEVIIPNKTFFITVTN